MLWAVFSAMTAFIWAIVAIVDKYVIAKWAKNPLVSVIFLGIVSLIVSGLVYAVRGYAQLSPFNIFLSFAAGTAYVGAVVFYFKAVEVEEISRVVPLVYLSPLFIMVLAGAFLDEVFTPIKYLGIILLIAGATLISSKNLSKLRFGKAFWLMVASSIFIAIHAILTKYLLDFADFWTVVSYTRGIGMLPTLIPVFYFNYRDCVSAVREYGQKAVLVLSSKEALRLGGGILITIATSLGPVTLVNALSSVQPFFVLVFTIALGAFYPKILNEETGKSAIAMKLAAIVLMFAGVILVS